MKYRLFSIVVFALTLLSNSACEDKSKTKNVEPIDLEQTLIDSHKMKIKVEDEMIDQYVEKNDWVDVNKTGTGLRYEIYDKTDGPLLKNEDLAIVAYSLHLLNDTLIYQTQNRPDQIIVGHDDYPSGLHEGLLFMKEGEKARFVLPSHLAFGVTGNQIDIPMNSSLVYDLHLLSIQ